MFRKFDKNSVEIWKKNYALEPWGKSLALTDNEGHLYFLERGTTYGYLMKINATTGEILDYLRNTQLYMNYEYNNAVIVFNEDNSALYFNILK